MERTLTAHTPIPGSCTWHLLDDHLQATARLAEMFAAPMGCPALARVAGLLHDLGKASPAFQAYLQQCARAAADASRAPRRGVDHKTAGAAAGAMLCPALGFAILGHHAGLPSLDMLKNTLQHTTSMLDMQALIAEGTRTINADAQLANTLAREMTTLPSAALDADLLIRLLYSCLVDADALDTEAHFDPAAAAERGVSLTQDDLWALFLADQTRLQAQALPTAVNAVRQAVYADCLQAAELPPGVYTLTVPTGGGKTRSSLAFALAHARRHGLRRVIYAVPYTSIIEQTAGVFRGIFPDEQAVLEHHSAAPEPDVDATTARHLWARLATENWDAPLIVTTTVQCFESLFAARPAACRKVHHLAQSVLILDEVQTLPPVLLTPILDMLRGLVERYGTTVVLCTATQPALTVESGLLRGFSVVREIVRDPAAHFQALRRVTYTHVPTPWSWAQVADAMRAYPQCLTIVNTRADALAVLDTLADPDALHLSTLLCPAHRRAVLDDIRQRLREHRPCRVVSTQVVEAGVDVDFPCVMRAAGPLDRIVQAAGRCNREGMIDSGDVLIFTPDDNHMPRGAYATAFAHAQQVLQRPKVDLHDPAIFPAYFRAVFGDVQTDASGIQTLRERLDFPAVAAAFRMIPDDTVPVLVPYAVRAAEALVARVRAKGHLSRADWREAQQYSVAVRRRECLQYQCDGLVEEVLAESGLFRWLGGYTARGLTGVAWDAADLII